MKFKHSDIEIPREDPFKNCKLNRQPNAIILTQIVQNYSESFVLSINGEWGTGKTTFMKMWAAYLKQQEITSIYFNAWENDFISDPMVALLGELRQLATIKTAETLKSILKNGSEICLKTIPALTKGIVKHYCGDELAEVAKDALNAGAEIFKTEVIEYENKKNKLVTFKEELTSYIEESIPNKPLIFIIDELDRCRPDYAVEVLERIKHFFSIKGIVFVLSIDKEQLCNSIRGHYGSDRINAEEYLRRFIDVEYLLPKPDIDSYCKYLYEYFDFKDFFESDERYRNELSGNKDTFLRCSTEIIKAQNYSLRQIEKLFVHTRLVLCSCSSRHYVFPSLTFMLICIRTINPRYYQKIVNQQMTIEELVNFIPTVFSPNIFNNKSPRIHTTSLWGLAELFYCFAQSFARTPYPLRLIDDSGGSNKPKLAFTVTYVDSEKLANAIDGCYRYYRGADWGHIIKSIDLLNPME
ncbi:KAP family P-loop NTPase fold protein [Alistipes communis]|jgi:hypothetical protein|uniref:KAP family P-loop NTPase fold protein n=1 Tax=Alistipes communis TaxID=2585118 RepID=UPI00189ADBE1|nr:P-loop NTPase fold protein [Alistipes communis]